MNKYLDEQIRYFFGKSFDEMNEDEKMQVTSLTLAQNNFRGEKNDISILELRQFPNLQKCLLQEFDLTDTDIDVLKQIGTLKGIQFSNCNFASVNSSLTDLELVVLSSCENVPKHLLKGLKTLKYLRVVNQKYFDAEVLSSCSALERAYLQKTTILNLATLKRLPSLKLINLDGSIFNFLALHQLKSSMDVEYKRDYVPEPDR